MDVIIVAARSATQEHLWQKRLRAVYGAQTHVIVICDRRDFDFSDFSFLSIYAKAQEKAKYMYRLDLFELQKNGASVAIYHDYGAARRLFPLCASECGDPFSIKLPGTTLLEAVIANTQHIRGEKQGRLFVFRADLLVMPLYKAEASAAHIEVQLLPQHPLSPTFSISLSAQMTFTLMRELRSGTLCALKEKFTALHSEKRFFEQKSDMIKSYVWDYGSAKSYHQTMLKLSCHNREGAAMRLFYDVPPYPEPTVDSRVIIDESCCLINCRIASGSIKNSVLIDVTAECLEVENCVIIGSRFCSLQTELALLYRVDEALICKLSAGTIRADYSTKESDKKTALYSERGIDVSKYWAYRLPQNPASFAQIWDELAKF